VRTQDTRAAEHSARIEDLAPPPAGEVTGAEHAAVQPRGDGEQDVRGGATGAVEGVIDIDLDRASRVKGGLVYVDFHGVRGPDPSLRTPGERE
jgi:hypothetical protein